MLDRSFMNGSSTQWTPSTILHTIPSHSRYTPSTSSPISFFHLLSRLKTTKREGWRRFGINHGESIADHMYRMSIITMLCPSSLSSKLDIPRCTKMALVHDMAEALVGDITPVDGVLKTEKNRREAATMDYICDDLLGNVEGGMSGREVREVWQEYEDGQTLESRFVHDVDKIELVLQMVEYEKQAEGQLDIGEFTWVAKRIVLPEVKVWCEQLLQERADFWNGFGKVPSSWETMTSRREAEQKEYYDGDANGHANGNKP